MIKLYRFKSNPETVVRETTVPTDRHRHVQIVWSKAHEIGCGERFMYRMVPDNLQELTEEEVLEVLKKIGEQGEVK